MRFASLRATPVRVPVTRIAAFTRRKMTHVVNTLVEVETAAGVVRLGETQGEWSARLIAEDFAPKVVGLHPVATDVGVVRAVREALGPAVELAVDANMGFSVEQVRRFLAALCGLRRGRRRPPRESGSRAGRARASRL